MNVREYNRRAWDAQVEQGNPWTVPVSSEEVARARAGDWSIVLTPTRPVPRAWFGDLAGAAVLGLASAGGQQGPILAAAGARVTVLDNSPAQLARDREVAARDGLELTCVEGDMADLHRFADASFDLIVHPCSNCFVPEVRPVWREAYRVLRPGGALLAGFTNPMRYLFDDAAMQRGELTVRHRLPYSDLDLTEAERAALGQDTPLEFSHTLADQLGGQLEAGFVLTDLFEDRYPADGGDVLSAYLDTFIATRAVKLP
jgi:SAM-dependent methyltransferase